MFRNAIVELDFLDYTTFTIGTRFQEGSIEGNEYHKAMVRGRIQDLPKEAYNNCYRAKTCYDGVY